MNGADRRVKFPMLAWALGVALLGQLAAVRTAAAAPTTPGIPKTLPDGWLVLPFANESGVRSLEWMRVGLPAALAEKLETHPGLRPVGGELILPDAAAGDPLDAAGIAATARAAGARFVWTGRYTRPKWKLQFTVQLWSVDPSGARLVAERLEHGDFGKTFSMVSDAALALLEKAGHPAPEAVAAQMRRVPTRDFYSFTLYGRGLLALHGLGAPGDPAAAEKALERAVYIDPRFAEAHRLLAVVYARKGKPGMARGQLSYALDLRPGYYAALAMLVRSAHEAKQRGEAIELAARALALRPFDLEVRYLLGEMLWEEGDVDGAYRELKRLTDLDPGHLSARRILVLIHAAKAHGEALAQELERIIALDPTDEAARMDLGAAYHAIGRDDRAIAIYEGLVAKNPKHLQALKFLGDLHRSRGDLQAAIGYYERALAANRNDPRPYFLLGAAYLERGDTQKALRIYQAARRFSRYLPETYSNLGALHYKLGNNVEALRYLRTAATRRSRNARIRYNYGLALARAKQRDKALAEFMMATELDPKEAEFHYALGVALLRLGRLDEAEKAFHACVHADAKHPDARHNLRLIDELRRRAREGEIQVE